MRIGLALIVLQGVISAQTDLRIALVKMPYVGERNAAELSGGPDYLEQGGIQKQIEGTGCRTKPASTVVLAAAEEKAYGEWNRLALANGELAKIVAAERHGGQFPIALLANCSSLSGMLSGLQHSGPTAKPLRVGLVFTTLTAISIHRKPP